MSGTAPATAAAALDAYRQATADARILGHILWYTIRRARVAPADLARWLDELGLDPRLLPAPINPVHAFKVATSEAKLEYPMPRAGQTALVQIREVTADHDKVIRHVMREVRDARRVRLSYQPVGEAVFRRHTPGSGGPSARFTTSLDPADPNPRTAAEGARLRDWLRGVHARYHDLCVHLQSPRLRAVLREAITALDAVAVRPSGGVYFAHLRHSTTLHALQQLVARFGEGCRFHLLPLPDTLDQRQMLTEAFQDQITGDCDDLTADIAQHNQHPTSRVSVDDYLTLNQRWQTLTARCTGYADLLRTEQARANAALDLAATAIADLAGRIDPTL